MHGDDKKQAALNWAKSWLGKATDKIPQEFKEKIPEALQAKLAQVQGRVISQEQAAATTSPIHSAKGIPLKTANPTGHLQQTRATAPLPTQELPPPPPSDEELSPRRLAMINDFMGGNLKVQQMNDPTFMYKVVSDERAYQTERLMTQQQALRRALQATSPDAEELEAQVRRTQAIVQNLFKVLKRITGKQGATGGTNFLSPDK
jgi:hypothetical protein